MNFQQQQEMNNLQRLENLQKEGFAKAKKHGIITNKNTFIGWLILAVILVLVIILISWLLYKSGTSGVVVSGTGSNFPIMKTPHHKGAHYNTNYTGMGSGLSGSGTGPTAAQLAAVKAKVGSGTGPTATQLAAAKAKASRGTPPPSSGTPPPSSGTSTPSSGTPSSSSGTSTSPPS